MPCFRKKTTSCQALLQVDDMISCNISGRVFIFHFLQRGSKHLWVAQHNEQLPLYAAQDPKYLTLSVLTTILYIYVFGAECGIWQTFLQGLQLLSCRVSCHRFDRFHFTLSHWQRCYKQVQITTKCMKVEKKKKTATERRQKDWGTEIRSGSTCKKKKHSLTSALNVATQL